MAEKTGLTQEESQLESLLGQLTPRVHPGSRDRLMFAAGRATAGHVRRWQGISGILLVFLVCSLIVGPEQREEDRFQVAPQIAIDGRHTQCWHQDSQTMDALAYIKIRHRVLQQGLEALPDTRDGVATSTDHMNRTLTLKTFLAL